MQYSKVTQKYQATIPLNIRKILKLNKGDVLLFKINNKQIIIDKAEPFDIEYHKALQSTLASEWNSKEDDQAYNDL